MKKKLVFFDIDETVFHTFAMIHVLKNGHIIKKLNNKEFNTYQLQEGESFDFSEFRDSTIFYKTSIPILNIMKLVRNYIKNNDKVIFLTAREDFNDKNIFLETFRKYNVDIDKSNVYVERTGNLKWIQKIADRKKETIKKYLSNQYSEVKMYDDDILNLLTFKEYLSKLNYNFNAIHVSGNGKMKKL